MASKWKPGLSGVIFYGVLAVCAVVIGVSGYMLFVRETPEVPETTDTPAQEEASAPAPQMPETPVEAVAPEPIEEPAPVTPIETVDNTPIPEEQPQLIVSPLQGEVVAAFSVDALVYNETLEDWRTHDGIDISARLGTTVAAASAGTVASVTEDPLMGTAVVIQHSGGYQTTYANLQAQPTVEVGDTVTAGQIIGAVGETAAAESAQGPHLHFSVRKDGETVDPNAFLSQ